MKPVNQAFRRAIYNGILGVEYRNVTIPVWSEFLNGQRANLDIGNNVPVKAWVKLMNQTADNDSPKCMRNDRASIQIQVQVSFNANSGNYEHSENILTLVLAKLFDEGISIEAPFSISLLDKGTERSTTYMDDTARVYMSYCLITALISQP